MPRNLDLTALRSFVVVAETGGVTRAAGFLNLTQSAVSMQIKRLEEMLDTTLLDRSARKIALTGEGEQLLGYARRMLQLNDELLSRMTSTDYEGELVLGVPHDIVYPFIPQVLQRFAQEMPRVKVNLLSSYTTKLKEQFAQGKVDIILTTEEQPDAGGEVLVEQRLVWVGAPGGAAWRGRPLRLAYEYNCFFRPLVQSALDDAGIAWEMAVESDSTRTIEASVSADLAVHSAMEGHVPRYLEEVNHAGALPELPLTRVIMYTAEGARPQAVRAMRDLLRQNYCKRGSPRLVDSDYNLAG
ncbi:LysR family transcriptional regulator [Actibacterium mucosum KCTC 23349]|uniref:LysR family transcriptional regulator n=1 Tax=Actibacterium mucosum KCTC 23349 TaxID=1454373 RepID=A0A037ZLS0_9RHOB|nr:LysR family transcriptional regulator [Actibacterium mucosum]KAJ56472.1 LysR family transcriptional regulator [Actibacterium mucosum KCTC 23349]